MPLCLCVCHCSPIPPSLHMKVIPPGTDIAEYISKHWYPANIDYPSEHKIRFLNDLITAGDFLGVYTEDNNKYPVAWMGRKPGDILLLCCIRYPVRLVTLLIVPC